MKQSIIIILLLLSTHTIFAQSPEPIILYATKLISKYPSKSITIMDKTAVKKYLGAEAIINTNEAYVYKSGAIFKIQKDYYFMPLFDRLNIKKLRLETDKILATLKPIGYEKDLSLSSGIQLVPKKPKDSNIVKIKNIQRALLLLGYKSKNGRSIKEDGVMGIETKKAIQVVFGIECEKMTEKQIIEEIGKLTYKPVAKKSEEEIKYNLEIRDEEGISNEILTQKELFDKLSNLSCSVDQICLEKKVKHGSLQFNCSSNGHSVSINISTEGKIEFGLNVNNGDSAKFSIDKDGKLEISASDSKGVSIN
ncbi:hypothetical protein H9Q08_17170 [Chryseobacterium sp. PS-8]|uniref:Peptidoglycan binding-like domain-containing protein n=1 Tax=Chryseobacterium indicum TaxID=2766954 RepID=A0ABS9CA16_9FLAO|nr:hypothetical protein [Chryseobacterium sp. PS-8]MCF2221019.1 hypothetical protein [Chryseobacterium sp. PS-8]